MAMRLPVGIRRRRESPRRHHGPVSVMAHATNRKGPSGSRHRGLYPAHTAPRAAQRRSHPAASSGPSRDSASHPRSLAPPPRALCWWSRRPRPCDDVISQRRPSRPRDQLLGGLLPPQERSGSSEAGGCSGSRALPPPWPSLLRLLGKHEQKFKAECTKSQTSGSRVRHVYDK